MINVPSVSIREQALSAYSESVLLERDSLGLQLMIEALQDVLGDLGIDFKVDGPFVEIDGLALTANLEQSALTNTNIDMIALDTSIAKQRVTIQAHEKCKVCGQMKHSDFLHPKKVSLSVQVSKSNSISSHGISAMIGQMQGQGELVSVSIAAQIGQWLITPHDCIPSAGRKMGFNQPPD